jgi:beta-glucanase (GH16 family)
MPGFGNYSHTKLLKEKNMLLSFLICFLAIISNDVFAQDYQLIWSDEFNGSKLDNSKWEHQIGNGSGGWGNNEKQYYRVENTVVSNGYLTITAKKENYNNFNYTSSRIRTINKGDWKYGKFEMRAKMPVGKGIWPAFWMMPTESIYGGWAASGEIDIMEYLGHETKKVYGTIHYGGSWPNNKSSGGSYLLTSGGFNDDFHTFTLIWEERKMEWFVDEILYSTKTNWNTAGHSFPAPFDQKFHFILNLAVGGNWPGYPDETTTFPQEYVIDYVRVYQTITGINEEEFIPNDLSLSQNYPNPFNGQTIINYNVSKTCHVKLILSDMLGRTITILVDKTQGPVPIRFRLMRRT